MDNKKQMTARSRYNSFGFAIKGILALLKQEPNMRIHALAAIIVIVAGFVRHITSIQWIAIAIAIGIVWIAEAFNTCIEMLCDLYSIEYNSKIKFIKDIAAAGVLIASIISVVIGIFVFFF